MMQKPRKPFQRGFCIAPWLVEQTAPMPSDHIDARVMLRVQGEHPVSSRIDSGFSFTAFAMDSFT
jgi:hypothetical protein